MTEAQTLTLPALPALPAFPPLFAGLLATANGDIYIRSTSIASHKAYQTANRH